jgi:nitrite reductase (NADH) large subunit
MFSPHGEGAAKSAETPPERWRCTVCDYIHQGPEPPAECPVCGVDASLFQPADEAGEEPTAAEVATGGDRLLIVGGGVAAVTAAEHARRGDGGLAITVVHREPSPPYNRLNLTRHLAGEIAADALALHDAQWYASRHIELIQGEVVAVDLEARRAELRDGRRLAWDRLILANGAHPFVPPIAGAQRDGVQPLRTRSHAADLLDRVAAGSACMCIGGGLLGLETAGALARRGARVTVVEGFDWLLPRQLARPAADLLEQHLASLGITVRCAARVAEIVGDEAVHAVRFEDGEELPASAVVLSTGVRPNSFLARQCGLEVHTGVVVDDAMATSAVGVWAAGDVAEHRGVVYGLWPAAIAQGGVAGSNAAGGSATFAGIPPAAQLKVLDVDVYSIGDFMPRDGASRVIERRSDETYQRVVCRDGCVVGANLYGDVALAGQLRRAIESGTQIADLPELVDRFPELR